jgi:hypothetical protein
MQSLEHHRRLLFLQAGEKDFKHDEANVSHQFKLKQVGKTQFKRYTISNLLQVFNRRTPNRSNA